MDFIVVEKSQETSLAVLADEINAHHQAAIDSPLGARLSDLLGAFVALGDAMTDAGLGDEEPEI